jgi:hypothetical protein
MLRILKNIAVGLVVVLLCAAMMGLLSLTVGALMGAFGPAIALLTMAGVALVFMYFIGKALDF